MMHVSQGPRKTLVSIHAGNYIDNSMSLPAMSISEEITQHEMHIV